MVEIVAHTGVVGSGKDYRADKLAETGYVRVDFKDALLDMVSDIAGYDARADYNWFKQHPVGVMRPADPLQEAFLHSEWSDVLRKHPELITGRKLLQRVGTEAMRKRHPSYWVDQFLVKAAAVVAEGHGVANSDCRFFNEVEAIKKLCYVRGAKIPSRFVFCDFRSSRYDPHLGHASEKLAQNLLNMGLEDGDEITDQHFSTVASVMNETFDPITLT